VISHTFQAGFAKKELAERVKDEPRFGAPTPFTRMIRGLQVGSSSFSHRRILLFAPSGVSIRSLCPIFPLSFSALPDM
jgi:hypothetical protein